ncbi:hypothetical protein [Arenibacter nanhaiticus]|nr:hypothetical protein [Arenibacter nanhaiticus]
MEKPKEVLADYRKGAKLKREEMVGPYYIDKATLDPTIAVRLTANWISLNLRYINDYKLS